jgi:hypothetical protein
MDLAWTMPNKSLSERLLLVFYRVHFLFCYDTLVGGRRKGEKKRKEKEDKKEEQKSACCFAERHRNLNNN